MSVKLHNNKFSGHLLPMLGLLHADRRKAANVPAIDETLNFPLSNTSRSHVLDMGTIAWGQDYVYTVCLTQQSMCSITNL